MNFELRINNRQCSFEPVTCGDVLYESYACGRCSKLTFDILGDYNTQFSIREGDMVSLKAGSVNVFFGIIFQRRKGADDIIRITAYDQLRYLRNKDTYVYSNMRASDVVCMIALDYRLRLGDVQQTDYVIPHRIEDNVTLADIVQNALDLELEQSGQRFMLIDEFGRLSLRDETQMFSRVILDRDTVGALSFFSSIDKRSNRVKASRYDRKSGRREIVIANDGDSENRLGILQHYMKLADQNEVLHSRAHAMLALCNKDERSISVSNALGHINVRGGSRVELDIGDFEGKWRVLKCVHRLSENKHLMDLCLEE